MFIVIPPDDFIASFLYLGLKSQWKLKNNLDFFVLWYNKMTHI